MSWQQSGFPHWSFFDAELFRINDFIAIQNYLIVLSQTIRRTLQLIHSRVYREPAQVPLHDSSLFQEPTWRI